MRKFFSLGAGGDKKRAQKQRRAAATQKVSQRKTKGWSNGKIPKQR